MAVIVLINLCISFALTGFILVVAITHYPTFRYIDTEKWNTFHTHHTRSISLVVMPLMLIELGLSSWLLWTFPQDLIFLLAFVLVQLIWLNTFLQAIPLHNALGKSHDNNKIERLIRINWIRTVLWVLKTGLLLYGYMA